MRARWLCLAALVAAAPVLASCGGTAVSGASEAVGSQLAIYSSLPLQGREAAVSRQIVDGETLALAETGGRVGPFKVGYVSLDDSNESNGRWDPGISATNAKTAAEDTSTIAYIGDLDSGATAITLPLMNAAGILQVSPASPYVGLTSSRDAGQDEPERFYPSGKRTFGRLQPGDPVEAAAQVRLMSALGVHRVYVLDNEEPFAAPLAELVAEDAARAGIEVAAHDSLATPGGTLYSGEVEKVVHSQAQAVFFAGGGGPGAVALWQQLHDADPDLLLLGSRALAETSFTSQIGAAAGSTYLTTPLLALDEYPPSARRVLAASSRQFGGEAGPWVLYGYEAMSVVLDSIRSAGVRGNVRRVVTERFFATSDRSSVIGRYSIDADGETTLSRYGVDRVVGGRPVFYRAIEVN